MSQLTPIQCEQAVGLVQRGTTQAFIARTFSCSHSAVTNLMQRYRQRGQTSGTPSVTMPLKVWYLHTCICGIAS